MRRGLYYLMRSDLSISVIPAPLIPVANTNDFPGLQQRIVNELGADIFGAPLRQQRHPPCFFNFGTLLAEVSLAFEPPLITCSHPVPEPVHITCWLCVHWLTQFWDLVLIKV